MPSPHVSAQTIDGLDLILQGMTLRAAAARVGVDPSTLSKACKRAGIELPRGVRPAPTIRRIA